MNLLIKICGIKYPENAREVAALNPDLMGFIFYPASPRFVGNPPDPELFRNIPASVSKTGVFVNAHPEDILNASRTFGLPYIQLHGNESPEICRLLKNNRLSLMKAFPVQAGFDFAQTKAYEPFCEYFLFDTSSPAYGGTGKQFDWNILQEYQGTVPFFLSGGIGPDDAEKILRIFHPSLAGVDVNSRFETEPGRKNILMLKHFTDTIRTHTS